MLEEALLAIMIILLALLIYLFMAIQAACASSATHVNRTLPVSPLPTTDLGMISNPAEHYQTSFMAIVRRVGHRTYVGAGR